jgi:hypothetical protein
VSGAGRGGDRGQCVSPAWMRSCCMSPNPLRQSAIWASGWGTTMIQDARFTIVLAALVEPRNDAPRADLYLHKHGQTHADMSIIACMHEHSSYVLTRSLLCVLLKERELWRPVECVTLKTSTRAHSHVLQTLAFLAAPAACRRACRSGHVGAGR